VSQQNWLQIFLKKIQELIENDIFVILLIDEVESISKSRSTGTSQDNAESMRVVNTVLLKLDTLRNYPNCLVLATSNFHSAIDPAFLDRVDIQHRIERPLARSIYTILRGTILELMRTEIIYPKQSIIQLSHISGVSVQMQTSVSQNSKLLFQIAEDCVEKDINGRFF